MGVTQKYEFRVSFKGSAWRIYFWYISKDDAINIMNNSSLIDKIGVLQIFFIIYKKWVAQLLSKKQRCNTKQREKLLWKY